eukprot:CAMPEP_0204388944 /NCGR_PEP_ID=MMETSP0469-20131031/59823_1 /ASSEMBLY_ACC=CAM_ASM_000384 /TAXON_ID=2969 /ORGANISM="Oxyrrhis marina" /LENGTH=59 /DNA_ID=CAMNT_0051382551 /DNA_START=10 /DNA_END=185 /DNA_ORIENTATION=+
MSRPNPIAFTKQRGSWVRVGNSTRCGNCQKILTQPDLSCALSIKTLPNDLLATKVPTAA